METDSFFYHLFNQLPETLFQLLGQPAARAKAYRFDSVEVKKAFRIDGLFLPKRRRLPLYVVEVQFQRRATFYANLFAKVFSYLEENDPRQDWCAVAIFPTRSEEPKALTPYEDLLRSKRVRRIYLEDIVVAATPPVGLEILQLLQSSLRQAQELAPRVVERARTELSDSDLQAKVVELVEPLLMERIPEFDLEGVRMKFKLHDLRESKAWQELRGEGEADAFRKIVVKLLEKRKTLDEISALLDTPVEELRRILDEPSR